MFEKPNIVQSTIIYSYCLCLSYSQFPNYSGKRKFSFRLCLYSMNVGITFFSVLLSLFNYIMDKFNILTTPFLFAEFIRNVINIFVYSSNKLCIFDPNFQIKSFWCTHLFIPVLNKKSC